MFNLPTEALFLLAVFVAVLALSQLMYLSVSRQGAGRVKAIRRQLGKLKRDLPGGGELSILRQSKLAAMAPWQQGLEQLPLIRNLANTIELAGGNIAAHKVAALLLLAGALLARLGWDKFQSLPVAAGMLVLPWLGYRFYLQRRFSKKLELFEEQLPDALDIFRRALQTGYSFNEAIKMIADEMEDPLRTEFYLVFASLNVGHDIRTALLNLVERVPSVSTLALATAVSIQKETGGNLAENLDKLSDTIRQRFKFQRKVKSLSAEGRMSAWILVLTPFALMAVLQFSSPGYLEPLMTSDTGKKLLIGGAVTMAIGVVWISRIIRIEV